MPTAASDPQSAITVHELGPITLRLVGAGANSRLWNEFIGRYHYLGYTPMSGSQLRYNVFAGEQLVVNNARFLILPWIRSKGLASGSDGSTGLRGP